MAKSKTISKGSDTHILVIRLSAMGDVAMTVPVLRTFRNTYPEIKLTVLTRKFFEPIFNDIQDVEVYHADVHGKHKGILGLTRLFRELKKLQITEVADVHNVLRSNVLKTLFTLNGIKVAQIDKGRLEKKQLTSPKDKVFKQLKTSHQRYADVFSELGYPLDLKEHVFPQKQSLTSNILQLAEQSTKKWLGIAPFAQYEGKTYPLDLMVAVIEKLSATQKYQIFLFGGGKREKDIFNNIQSKYDHVINVVGKLSFEEELILINNLDGMLSMDSGNAHLAAMYDIPTITIWGVTHPYAGFMPFDQPTESAILPDLKKYPLIPTSIYGNKLPEGYEKVMYSIQPEEIVNTILSKV